jgi:hypothetical protein
MSSSVILFNKYILDEKKLNFRESANPPTAIKHQLTILQASPSSSQHGISVLQPSAPRSSLASPQSWIQGRRSP